MKLLPLIVVIFISLLCFGWYWQLIGKNHVEPQRQSIMPSLEATNVTNLRQSPLTPMLTPVLSVTTTNTSKSLNTAYLTGTYPSVWNYYALVRREYGNYSVCTEYAEAGHFVKQGGNDVYIAICPVTLLDPEQLLEAIAPNTNIDTALKYTPHTAVSATRFGVQGLKGIWLQGVQGGYVPAYFEIYVKNKHMFLMEALAGYTKDIEDLLRTITLNL